MTSWGRMVQAFADATRGGKTIGWPEVEAILRAKEQGAPDEIEVGSIYGHRTQEGLVELTLNGERTQMDVRKAREVVGMFHEAIEAAISDAVLVRFLVDKVGLPVEAAAAALFDFREIRQGSREKVRPS